MNIISRELLLIAKEIKVLDEEGDGSGFQMQHDHENAEQERLDIATRELIIPTCVIVKLQQISN